MTRSGPGKNSMRYAVETVVRPLMAVNPDSWWTVDSLITSPTGASANIVLTVRGIRDFDSPDPKDVTVEIIIRASIKPAKS